MYMGIFGSSINPHLMKLLRLFILLPAWADRIIAHHENLKHHK